MRGRGRGRSEPRRRSMCGTWRHHKTSRRHVSERSTLRASFAYSLVRYLLCGLMEGCWGPKVGRAIVDLCFADLLPCWLLLGPKSTRCIIAEHQIQAPRPEGRGTAPTGRRSMVRRRTRKRQNPARAEPERRTEPRRKHVYALDRVHCRVPCQRLINSAGLVILLAILTSRQ